VDRHGGKVSAALPSSILRQHLFTPSSWQRHPTTIKAAFQARNRNCRPTMASNPIFKARSSLTA